MRSAMRSADSPQSDMRRFLISFVEMQLRCSFLVSWYTWQVHVFDGVTVRPMSDVVKNCSDQEGRSVLLGNNFTKAFITIQAQAGTLGRVDRHRENAQAVSAQRRGKRVKQGPSWRTAARRRTGELSSNLRTRGVRGDGFVRGNPNAAAIMNCSQFLELLKRHSISNSLSLSKPLSIQWSQGWL